MRTLFTIFTLSLFANLLLAQAITFTSSCDANTICSYEADCGPAFAGLIAEASTTCPSGNLAYSYDLDLYNDGFVDQSGSVADASSLFPLGEHKLTFTATDDCNNSASCEVVFTMKDCVAPEIFAYNGLAIDIEADGSFELLANTYDNGSIDNCGINSWLINSPAIGPGQNEPPVTASPSIIFDCDQTGTQTVDLWAGDAAGNWNFISSYVLVQDNLNVCSSDPSFELCLYSETECGEPIEGVDYGIPQPPGIPDFLCTIIDASTTTLPLTIAPIKNIDPLNGVSTFDLILIVRHILGVQLLDSPYKIIAADVNNSGAITAMDLVNLRQLILGAIAGFPNNTSWRFVDKEFVFPNAQNPWATSFPEICTINTYDEDITKTFIGMKIGDVSNNTLPCDSLWNTDNDDRNAETLTFDIENYAFSANETIRIPFEANSTKNIAGYQFELDFDSKALAFTRFEKGSLKELDATNFGLKQISEGKIKTSWTSFDPSAQDLNGQVLFYLNFKATKDGNLRDFIKIADNELSPESYSTDLKIGKLELNFTDPDALVFENFPNPFTENTIVNFQLDEDQMVSLSIVDLNGKLVKTIQRQAVKGFNRVHLHLDENFSSGIYFCQLITQNSFFTTKMIKL